MSLSLTPASQTAPGVKYTSSFDEPPYNVRLVREEGPNCKPGCWVLRWDFNDPNPPGISYFDIYWYDERNPSIEHTLKWGIAGHSRAWIIDYEGTQESLYRRFGCEKHIVFVVSANWTDKTTGYLRYLMPKCPASLTVTFDTLELPWTGDGWDAGPCDTIEVYYTLMVNDQKKDFWGGCSFGTGCFTMPLKCGTYTFKELAPSSDPFPDRITVSAYNENVILKIVTLFYDYDDNADDVFAPFVLEHSWPTRAAAEAELGCNGKSFVTDMHVNDTADSKLHYTISILPNPCKPYQP